MNQATTPAPTDSATTTIQIPALEYAAKIQALRENCEAFQKYEVDAD